MKLNGSNKNDAFFFIEFAAVVAFLLLPPLFSAEPFTLPPKPDGLYAQSVFCFYTLCAAAYEELLYRLYTPHRLHRIYCHYIEPQLRGNGAASESNLEKAVDLPQMPLSHQQPSYKKAAVSFEFFLTEFPALLLFTLAHRYLGAASMLFAAGAGILFRLAYLKLKQALYPAASFAVIVAIHGLWNIGVYYYLWRSAVAVQHFP